MYNTAGFNVFRTTLWEICGKWVNLERTKSCNFSWKLGSRTVWLWKNAQEAGITDFKFIGKDESTTNDFYKTSVLAHFT